MPPTIESMIDEHLHEQEKFVKKIERMILGKEFFVSRERYKNKISFIPRKSTTGRGYYVDSPDYPTEEIDFREGIKGLKSMCNFLGI